MRACERRECECECLVLILGLVGRPVEMDGRTGGGKLPPAPLLGLLLLMAALTPHSPSPFRRPGPPAAAGYRRRLPPTQPLLSAKKSGGWGDEEGR